MVACEGPPARPKPWRHLVDPTPVANVDDDGGSPVADRTRERADAEERRAHTLRIRLDAEPASLDPLTALDEEAAKVLDDTIFETLLRRDDSSGELEPGLVESWKVEKEGLEIRLTLRSGVTFHDGTPMTSTDAQFSIDNLRGVQSRSPRLRAAFADVASADVWGPRDLRVELRRANSNVLRALAEVPVVPAHLYTGDHSHGPRVRAPVGTGPYKLVKWLRGDRIILARNETYWGPAPAIGDVELLIISDGARALALAEQGELDILPVLIPEHWPEHAAHGDFVDLQLQPPHFRALILNTRRPPFDDVRMRRALGLLIDRQKIAHESLRGLARPIAAPVWPGGPGDGEAPPAPIFEPLRGLELLDEVGWKPGDKDSPRVRGETKLHVVLLGGADPRDDAEREIVLAGLRRAGFWVEVRAGDAAAVANRLQSGDFDLALVELRTTVDADLGPYLGTGGAYDWGGFSSPEVDAALAELRITWSARERQARTTRLGQLIVDEAPMVTLVALEPHGLVAKRVHGLKVRRGWFGLRDLSFAESP